MNWYLVHQFAAGQTTTISKMTSPEACFEQLRILEFIGYNLAMCTPI